MLSVSEALDKLKHELRNEKDSSRFEKLVAALIGRLLDVPIAVASSGFQHGADAGPAGQQGRRFRLECKRYGNKTRLSERELLGEVDQALARDEALEGWFLCATCTVNEKIVQSFDQHGGKNGVPVLIIDWTDFGMTPLAALCAFSPEVVGEFLSASAADAARDLQSASDDAIERLKSNLQSWCLGFASLRQKSHEILDEIWNCPRRSVAVFGQNVAGGATTKKVRRENVHDSLNHWWHGPARHDAPAVVMGLEGVGKTWATLDWLLETKIKQSVILTIPSSAVVGNLRLSDTDLRRLLAERLYALTHERGPNHWHRRLDRLLKRPEHEGPAFTILFDGLNQQPSVLWLNLLKVLQSEPFAGRIRVIVSTRRHHFENRLSKLKGLICPAVPIKINSYDAESGGELDQMLAFEELARDDLHRDVLEMARTPRLFELVVRFRQRLGEAGQITLHRLLWEYGRDRLGVRSERSFSEDEWLSWSKSVAQRYRDGIRHYSMNSLGESVDRPDLSALEVYARLSDIIDGRFAMRTPAGDLKLTPPVVAHALGVTLLQHLDQQSSIDFEALDVELARWLDPIAGFDHTAEILRAGVSILIEQGRGTTPATGVLLTAWLQAQ